MIDVQLMQGEKFCVIIGPTFPKVASITMTYQLAEASKYIVKLACSKS